MTVVLKATKHIPIDDFLSGKLKRHGIKIVTGYEAGPILYLCLAGTALRACPDDKGYCDFVVLDNGDLPLSILDVLMHEFDCGIERLVDDRGRVVTSLDTKQAVIDFLGQEYLAPGDLIWSCIDGSASPPEPGSVLCEQVEIARALLGRNPKLHEDTKMLLLLVEDLYEQRHPPFKMTLRSKNPVVAQLCAEAMLAWSQAGQPAPTTTTHRSDSSDAEVSDSGPRRGMAQVAGRGGSQN